MRGYALAAIAAMGNPNLNFGEIILTIGGGALASVPFYTFFGGQIRDLIRKIFPRRKPMSFKRRRQIYLIWKKYGITGVSFLSPLISPMLAVAIAVAFQEKPRKIILYVGTAVLSWTLVFALLRETVLDLLSYFSIIS